ISRQVMFDSQEPVVSLPGTEPVTLCKKRLPLAEQKISGFTFGIYYILVIIDVCVIYPLFDRCAERFYQVLTVFKPHVALVNLFPYLGFTALHEEFYSLSVFIVGKV